MKDTFELHSLPNSHKVQISLGRSGRTKYVDSDRNTRATDRTSRTVGRIVGTQKYISGACAAEAEFHSAIIGGSAHRPSCQAERRGARAQCNNLGKPVSTGAGATSYANLARALHWRNIVLGTDDDYRTAGPRRERPVRDGGASVARCLKPIVFDVVANSSGTLDLY